MIEVSLPLVTRVRHAIGKGRGTPIQQLHKYPRLQLPHPRRSKDIQHLIRLKELPKELWFFHEIVLKCECARPLHTVIDLVREKLDCAEGDVFGCGVVLLSVGLGFEGDDDLGEGEKGRKERKC